MAEFDRLTTDRRLSNTLIGRIFGVNRNTVARWIASEQLKDTTISGIVRFSEARAVQNAALSPSKCHIYEK
jgi:hypothetical protein